MKNSFLALFFTLISGSLIAQEGFKLGLQGGLPLDNEAVSLSVGLDVGYMYALGEVVDVGIMTGFIYGFAETFQSEVVVADLPDIQFLPIAAGIRVWTSNSFSFGGEIGQAIGINDGNDGGLYYRPVIGYLMGPKTEVNLSYTTIQLDGDSWTAVNFGVMYTFTSRRSR
jgi:hypothetical protein